MPAWYVHMEAARQIADRLRNGDVPPGFPVGAAEARDIGEICHTWRNYLALGSVGPDLFYLMPDFAASESGVTQGPQLREIVAFALETWDKLDKGFIEKWDKWISPVSADAAELASQLTGGLTNQFANILDDFSKALFKAFEGILARFGDVFGALSSGPPQAFPNSAFYWADIFHYRNTYQMPFVMFQRAHAALDAAVSDQDRLDAQAQMAFAVGWMTHCGTDVTGHPFTNAKSGGPFRDHWQRHHLVELHIDSQNYSANHSGDSYGEIGTGAMHFWVAFRERTDGPYAGREDAPAYDYFTGFPPYDTSDTPTAAAARHELFDLDTGGLPAHLMQAMRDAIAAVHPDGAKILAQDPAFSATDAAGQPDGRPNDDALQQMWDLVYAFMKLTGSDGLSPRRPTPPTWITDHSFPTPPGGGYGVDDDPTRGADVEHHHGFNWLDLLLAVLAWIVFIAEVIIWLVTIIPSLALDVLTKWARDIVYQIQLAAWYGFILARRMLVMAGIIMPKPEEIDVGLTTLGTTREHFDIITALDDPMAGGENPPPIAEPSGRATSTSSFGLDTAYPRNVVRDTPSLILDLSLTDLLGFTHALHYADDTSEHRPSEWLAPWRYPLINHSGQDVPREEASAHAGPYVVGDASTVLLPGPLGDDAARHLLEQATSPQDTFALLNQLFPQDRHLGGPVDYGLYLIGRMVAERHSTEFGVPDFNLDSDRGYAWRCWNWDRHPAGPPTLVPEDPTMRGEWECVPDFLPVPNIGIDFHFRQPCTPPHFFHAAHDNPRRLDRSSSPFKPFEEQWYNPKYALRTHYLGRVVEVDPPPDSPDACLISDPAGPRPSLPDWASRRSWTRSAEPTDGRKDGPTAEPAEGSTSERTEEQP
jgi:hypothetical protein